MGTDLSQCRWCLENGLAGGEPVARNGAFYVMAKENPKHPAAMVIPFRHVEAPFDFNPAEWADFGEMLVAANAYLAQFAPHGLTVGWNVGAAGGQHIFHAHLHVICRHDDELAPGRGLRDFIFR